MQTFQFAARCDFNSEEDILVSSGEMAPCTGMFQKQELNGTLCSVGSRPPTLIGHWGVLGAGEGCRGVGRPKHLVRVPPRDARHAGTRVLAPCHPEAVKRLLGHLSQTSLMPCRRVRGEAHIPVLQAVSDGRRDISPPIGSSRLAQQSAEHRLHSQCDEEASAGPTEPPNEWRGVWVGTGVPHFPRLPAKYGKACVRVSEGTGIPARCCLACSLHLYSFG